MSHTPEQSAAALAAEQIHKENTNWLEDRCTLNRSTLEKIILAAFTPLLSAQAEALAKLEKELEQYRSIAESIGATKAVSERDDMRQQLADALEALKTKDATLRTAGPENYKGPIMQALATTPDTIAKGRES